MSSSLERHKSRGLTEERSLAGVSFIFCGLPAAVMKYIYAI
jgi:hypothetical protein